MEVGARETHLIDSRDPGPILHGMLSLDRLKLEGGRGGGVGMTLLLATAAHRRDAQTALLFTRETSGCWILYTGSEVANEEEDRKMLDQ